MSPENEEIKPSNPLRDFELKNSKTGRAVETGIKVGFISCLAVVGGLVLLFVIALNIITGVSYHG